MHTRRAIGADGDFGDLGDERAEALDHCHAAGASFRGCRPPIRHLGRLAQNTGMARCRVEQCKSAFHRIPSDAAQEFVDEGLDGKAGMGVTDRPPPERRDWQRDVVRGHFEIGDPVG
ncbi:hypothetical protein D3C72_1699590 [compost metagenome]